MIEKIKNCVFCNRESDKGKTLYETENFFINMGIGLAAPGHVMLIPKCHYACCADIPERLRPEFEDLAKTIIEKIKKNFGELFLIEYGVLGQSVFHAHLHFIPKRRKAAERYPAYEIKDLFEEIQFSADIPTHRATWEKAAELRKRHGGYVFLKDGGKAVLFERYARDLSYRHFFNVKLGISDIPVSWKEMKSRDYEIDEAKKQITGESLKFG